MFISLSFWRHNENNKNLGKLVLATVSKPQWSTVHYYAVVLSRFVHATWSNSFCVIVKILSNKTKLSCVDWP